MGYCQKAGLILKASYLAFPSVFSRTVYRKEFQNLPPSDLSFKLISPPPMLMLFLFSHSSSHHFFSQLTSSSLFTDTLFIALNFFSLFSFFCILFYQWHSLDTIHSYSHVCKYLVVFDFAEHHVALRRIQKMTQTSFYPQKINYLFNIY